MEVADAAVEEDHFGVGVGGAVVEEGAAVVGGGVGGAFEGAFDEDVAVGGLEVADPGEGAAAIAEGGAVGEEAAAAEDGVAAAVDRAVFHIDASIGLERVAVADDVDPVQGDAVAAQEQSLGLAHEVGGEGDVLQDEVVAMVEGHRRPPLREGARPLVGLDGQRVRVEDLVVRIMHAGDVGARADDGDMCLVPHVDDFLVVAGHHLDDYVFLGEVRNQVQGALQRAKVPGARGVDDEGVREGRRFRGGGEGPSAGEGAAFPRALGRREHALIDRHPIFVPILEHVVVRVDHRGSAAHEHGMEMERVRESADDGELVLRRCGLGRSRRGAGHGVPVRRHETAAVVVRDLGIVDVRRVRPALRRPRRHGQVEAVHALAARHVPDPDPSLIAHRRHLAESERQMRVHIDPYRPVRRAQGNLLCRCARRKTRHRCHHYESQDPFHHREN